MFRRFKNALIAVLFTSSLSAVAQPNEETQFYLAFLKSMKTVASSAHAATTVNGLADELGKVFAIAVRDTKLSCEQAELLKEFVELTRLQLSMGLERLEDKAHNNKRDNVNQEKEVVKKQLRRQELEEKVGSMAYLQAALLCSALDALAGSGVIEALILQAKEVGTFGVETFDTVASNYPILQPRAQTMKDWYINHANTLLGMVDTHAIRAWLSEISLDIRRTFVDTTNWNWSYIPEDTVNKIGIKIAVIGGVLAFFNTADSPFSEIAAHVDRSDEEVVRMDAELQTGIFKSVLSCIDRALIPVEGVLLEKVRGK